MLTLAEKIEVSKRCCQKAKDYIAEKRQQISNKFFNTDWEAFVVKRDEATGKYVGKFS